jgi:hypothetical protein
MFNMAFPVHCIIGIYSKKFNIGYSCDMFIIISNFNISYGIISISCKLNVMLFSNQQMHKHKLLYSFY